MKQMKNTLIRTAVNFTELLVIGTAVLLFAYLFAGQPLRVTGESMLPSFLDGEQIIAEKISVKSSDIERGSVVVFKHPAHLERLVIKRVIGLPHENILLHEGKIYINGRELAENYLPKETNTIEGDVIREDIEYKVPENSYVLLGDNRVNSTDSRNWGAVNKDLIVGKGFLVYFPLSKIRIIS